MSVLICPTGSFRRTRQISVFVRWLVHTADQILVVPERVHVNHVRRHYKGKPKVNVAALCSAFASYGFARVSEGLVRADSRFSVSALYQVVFSGSVRVLAGS